MMIVFDKLSRISDFEKFKKILSQIYSINAVESVTEIRVNGKIYTVDALGIETESVYNDTK